MEGGGFSHTLVMASQVKCCKSHIAYRELFWCYKMETKGTVISKWM